MKKTILVVDDNPDLLLSVKQGLESLDQAWNVIGVESGKDCLKTLESKQIPDLILLDIMMPVMTGWELFETLKKHPSWKQIPIVFLTARTDTVARSAGGFLGEDYIEKPFDIVELNDRINSVLMKVKKKKD